MTAEAVNESDALGLESGVVVVKPYDSRWAELYAQAAAALERAMGDRILSIEHVGSTAVPGLAAKPIIDILVGVPVLAGSLELVPVLGDEGYEYRPDEEIPERHYFRRLVRGRRTHHVSLAEPSSPYYRDTISFRDVLRREPALVQSYAALKLKLAARYPADRQSYTAGKTDFVLSVLSRAP